MTVKDLERLYDYGYWANKKLLAVVAQLTPEQFTQTVAGSYGSVRNTLVHILSAEWGWLDRCGGCTELAAQVHGRGTSSAAQKLDSIRAVRDSPKAGRRPVIPASLMRWPPSVGGCRSSLSCLDQFERGYQTLPVAPA